MRTLSLGDTMFTETYLRGVHSVRLEETDDDVVIHLGHPTDYRRVCYRKEYLAVAQGEFASLTNAIRSFEYIPPK